MPVKQNKEIALRLAKDGWGTVPGWEKVWDELVAFDMVQHFCSSQELISGLEANKEFQASLFQGFPQLKQTIEAVVTEDDKVVYLHTLEGSHTGNFIGVPPTGKSVKVTGFTMVRIVEGKIVEMWYETNLLEVMQQIGIIPKNN
ncbi:MAG: ester cyclase [Cyanobacteria bacterium P01_A01_bin.84]